ncbi:MAG: cytochrome P460 family protein [Bacteroidales bacterium]
MNRKTFLIFSALMVSAIVFFESCSSDDDDVTPPVAQEFVADNSSFTGFMNWSLDATAFGADPALGGMAHGGNDSTVVRNVYFKDGQDPVNGKYPQGTIIVKHSNNPDNTVNEFTAMVKRGGNFNPEANGWEWFMLAPDGTIAVDAQGNLMRGAKLMDNMCTMCHTAAASKDYVFSK